MASADAGAVTSLGLPAVSRGYPRPRGRLPSPYSPFRHWPLRPVRLACLIHAANVHSEPGSNPSNWSSPLLRRAKSPVLTFNGLRNLLTGRSSRSDRGKPLLARRCWLLDPSPSRFDLQPNGVETTQTAPRRLPSKVLINSQNHDRPDCQRTTELSTPLAGATCLVRACHAGPPLPTTSRPAVVVVGFPPPGQPAVSLSPVVTQATREIIPGWLRRSTRHSEISPFSRRKVDDYVSARPNLRGGASPALWEGGHGPPGFARTGKPATPRRAAGLPPLLIVSSGNSRAWIPTVVFSRGRLRPILPSPVKPGCDVPAL